MNDQANLPEPKPETCCGDRILPCKKCGADVWEYLDDHDNGDWCEASYKCGHCKHVIYIELPD